MLFPKIHILLQRTKIEQMKYSDTIFRDKQLQLEKGFYFILSVWSVYSVSYTLKTDLLPLALTNTVFGAVLCAVVYWLFCKINLLHAFSGKRLWILLFSLFFSFCLITGRAIYQTDSADYASWNYLFCMIGLAPILAALLLVLFSCFDKVPTACYSQKSPVRNYLVILIAWVPAFLASFPGIWAYDCVYQMQDFLAGAVTSHHPIAHTYLMCGLTWLGNQLFGSYEIGFAFYSVLQMLVLAGALAEVVNLVQKAMPPVIYGLVLAYFALIPINPLYSFSGTKDVLFAAFFTLWIIKIAELIVQGPETFWTVSNGVSLLLRSALMCMFRNNGIYVFLVTAVLLVLFSKRKRWISIMTMAIVMMFWVIYTGPIYSLLGVENGSVHEMLSIPCQQLSRVYTQCDDLAPEEKQAILEYIPQVENYVARTADPVKKTFNDTKFSEEPGNFLKLWVKIGLKHPGVYLDAFLNTNLGFWYPDMIYRDWRAWHPYIMYDNTQQSDLSTDGYVLLNRSHWIPSLENFYHSFSYDTRFQEIPVLSFFLQPAFPFWALMILLCFCLTKGYYKFSIPILVMLAYWGTCMLGPVVILRYAYPLITSVPVVYCMVFSQQNPCGKPNCIGNCPLQRNLERAPS